MNGWMDGWMDAVGMSACFAWKELSTTMSEYQCFSVSIVAC